MKLFDLLEVDVRIIPYRPQIARIVGNNLSAILLQQIYFRWKNNGKKPFYKFIEPCSHELYILGDSWCEELAFSKKVFVTARNAIAEKIKKGGSKNSESLVHYWTLPSRLTYYEINESGVAKMELNHEL